MVFSPVWISPAPFRPFVVGKMAGIRAFCVAIFLVEIHWNRILTAGLPIDQHGNKKELETMEAKIDRIDASMAGKRERYQIRGAASSKSTAFEIRA